jgi:hypothetical protein
MLMLVQKDSSGSLPQPVRLDAASGAISHERPVGADVDFDDLMDWWFEALSPDQAELCWLIFFEELTVPRASAYLGISCQDATPLVAEALGLLRAQFEGASRP